MSELDKHKKTENTNKNTTGKCLLFLQIIYIFKCTGLVTVYLAEISICNLNNVLDLEGRPNSNNNNNVL